jgi:ribosomal protein S18 acetylase RimI-like enzyme
MKNKLLVREAREEDTEVLEKLFQLTRQITFKSLPPEKFNIEDYKKSVEGEEVWLSEVDGNITGFISLWIQDNFIHNFFVHPDWQGRGIGQQLLDKAEERLTRPMGLKVTLDNIKARQFYQNRGWKIISTHEDEQESYILMRKY